MARVGGGGINQTKESSSSELMTRKGPLPFDSRLILYLNGMVRGGKKFIKGSITEEMEERGLSGVSEKLPVLVLVHPLL